MTERLELGGWRDTDVEGYASIVADAEVMRYLGGPLDRPAAWRQVALFIGHHQLRGWSQSAVVERASGELVGRGGLWQPEGWPGLEVGWVLARSKWGLGYARDLGHAVKDYAFSALAAPHLISVIHRDNAASIRVAAATGAPFERTIDMTGVPCVIYGQARPL